MQRFVYFHLPRWIFSDKQEFYLKIGRNIRLCYSIHLIFTGIQNYRNSVHRNLPEFTNSCLSDKIHRATSPFAGICVKYSVPIELIKRVNKLYNKDFLFLR